jgi:hypothetical protein
MPHRMAFFMPKLFFIANKLLEYVRFNLESMRMPS